MALKGKPPEKIEKRFKGFFYGPPNSYKTTTAMQFPRPYFIDCEKGAENDQYVELLKASGGHYWYCSNPQEVLAEVTELLSTKHNFLTLVIDPATTIYQRLVDQGIDEKGDDFGRYKTVSDRQFKNLINLITRLDMNVVMTSHAKPKWTQGVDAKGKQIPVQDGTTYDCFGSTDYLFDLVLEIEKRGKKRVAKIKKTRLEQFPEDETFEFSYAEIESRYGREAMHRQPTPQALATAEQVAELNRLIGLLKLKPQVVDKWLDKACAETLSELPEDAAAKCIDWCFEQTKKAS